MSQDSHGRSKTGSTLYSIFFWILHKLGHLDYIGKCPSPNLEEERSLYVTVSWTLVLWLFECVSSTGVRCKLQLRANLSPATAPAVGGPGNFRFAASELVWSLMNSTLLGTSNPCDYIIVTVVALFLQWTRAETVMVSSLPFFFIFEGSVNTDS